LSTRLSSDAYQQLANKLIAQRIVPAKEAEDALHIGIAVTAKMHYLLTWNFAHFVGPDAKAKLTQTLRAWNYDPPLLTTPEELMEQTK
jgi:hypothetical protein